MESSQERSTASTEAAQEGSTTEFSSSGGLGLCTTSTTNAPVGIHGNARIQQRLVLTIISFLARPFMQRLTLYIEPVLMLVMALLYT